MKKLLLMAFAAVAVTLSSCEKEDKINEVKVSLTSGGQALALEGVEVSLKSSANASVFSAVTDASGAAVFSLKAGAYEATTSTVYNEASIYNGASSTFSVVDGQENAFTLELVEVEYRQGIIIKELYFGGCTNDVTGKSYANDGYVILYNNSPVEADASNYSFGMLNPANSNGSNNYMKDGSLSYTDWMPLWAACWWFQTEVKIPAYSQIVISLFGAIDHTATVSASVDLSNADYAMYHPDVFANAKYQVSDNIPTSHYLHTYLYAKGSAWALSITSPAFVVFSPEGTTTEDFVKNPDNIDSSLGVVFNSAMAPLSWMQDAVEVFNASTMDKNNKRILASADAGYVKFTNKLGYTVYRNVDKEATEALPENEGKIVYNYSGGTDDIEGGSTDPSGIDAEASIANGAHIIYKDTNNSTNDFHQRRVASIKK